MVEKTQTKFGLKIWVSHLYAQCPSPTPDILVLVKETSVHAFHQTVVLLPHTKLIYQQLHLNLILQPGYSQPQFGPISRHGPWSCWLTLGKSCATWDWNHWVWSLEWDRVLVREGPGWVYAMQLGFESSVFHWWFYEVERNGRESKYWLCSLNVKEHTYLNPNKAMLMLMLTVWKWCIFCEVTQKY